MYATFALLLDRAIENAVNRIAWEIHLRWRTGVGVRRLPPHISLKQPFSIGDDLNRAEEYLATFAASVAPFCIRTDGFYARETVFGISIIETLELRALHNRLNADLPKYFDNTTADYDGDNYRFHVTVAQGGATPGTYQEILGTFAARDFREQFHAAKIALFVYDESDTGSWEYMPHTVLPLSGTTPDCRRETVC